MIRSSAEQRRTMRPARPIRTGDSTLAGKPASQGQAILERPPAEQRSNVVRSGRLPNQTERVVLGTRLVLGQTCEPTQGLASKETLGCAMTVEELAKGLGGDRHRNLILTQGERSAGW